MSTDTLTRTRYVLTGVLQASTAIHVGSGAGIPGIDLVMQTDGLGRHVITGTSLAGVLKAVVDRGKVPESVHKLLGSEEIASRWVVDDAPMNSDHVRQKDGQAREIRDGVAINRRTGAADPGALYSREVLRPGSRFDFRMELLDTEPPAGNDETAEPGLWLIRTCARSLIIGIRVGQGTTRGLGLIQLVGAKLTATGDLGTRAGVLSRLEGKARDVEIGKPESQHGILKCIVGWKPRGTLMCGVAVDGAVDTVPQTTAITADDFASSEVRLLLPGSSIKGALRARAELIVRTVLSGTTPHRSPGTVLEACDDDALLDVKALFGSPARRIVQGKKATTRGRRGTVYINDVHSTVVIPSDEWKKAMSALVKLPEGNDEAERKSKQRASFRAAIENLNAASRNIGIEFSVVDRVAVDRWTGGAASNRLFAAVEPTTCGWEPLTIEVDLNRLGRDEASFAVALLLLVVRDIRDGWVPLGRGTRRGWGDVKLTSIQIDTSGDPNWEWLDGDLLQPDEEKIARLDALIMGWYSRVEESQLNEDAVGGNRDGRGGPLHAGDRG